MEHVHAHRLVVGLLSGVIVLAVAAVSDADAAPRVGPTVILGSAATLAPDGQSMTIEVIAKCPERSTVVEASVTIAQPQATGKGTFALQCIGSLRPFLVTVSSSGAAFRLGDASATALVVTKRGHTEQAQDSGLVPVLPSVFVDLASTARLEGGGEAVSVDVTVACPVGSTPQSSNVNIGQAQASGQGAYVPICDGQRHTFAVTVAATTARFQAGSASGGAVGVVVWDGNQFYGQDIEESLQIA